MASSVPRRHERLLSQLRAHLAVVDEDPARRHPLVSCSDRGPAVACIVGSLALIFMEYADGRALVGWLTSFVPGSYPARYTELLELVAWTAVRLTGFVLVPAIAIRVLLRQRLGAYGLGPLPRRHVRAYLGLLAIVLPCVVLAARRPEFVAYYPFYRLAHASWLDLLAWELLYAAHFVGLEFFFRGFWLEACRRSFGSQAVLVSAVPYCMLHFTKPLMEVLAALPAGIVLGLLAMRARSIWGGAAVHVAVAWLMDALALAQSTGLPKRLWP